MCVGFGAVYRRNDNNVVNYSRQGILRRLWRLAVATQPRTVDRVRAAGSAERATSAHPTAALLRSLQWVSDGYVSPRDTAQIGVLLW